MQRNTFMPSTVPACTNVHAPLGLAVAAVKSFVRRSLTIIVLLAAASCPAQGVTVWTGPTMNFTESAGADGSQPADQDQLTPNVWLTRSLTQGLFNAEQEGGYTHFLSPTDTQWAYGSLANYSSLTYTNWEGWFGGRSGGGPRSTIGKPAVLHLVSDNIYLSVTFVAWGGSFGGFTYQRSTPAVPEPAPALLVLGALVITAAARLYRSRGTASGR